MSKDSNALKKAEQFLDNKSITYVRPGEIYNLSNDTVEVVFKHPLYNDPDYIICPDEYRVIVNFNTGIVDWGFQT